MALDVENDDERLGEKYGDRCALDETALSYVRRPRLQSRLLTEITAPGVDENVKLSKWLRDVHSLQIIGDKARAKWLNSEKLKRERKKHANFLRRCPKVHEHWEGLGLTGICAVQVHRHTASLHDRRVSEERHYHWICIYCQKLCMWVKFVHTSCQGQGHKDGHCCQPPQVDHLSWQQMISASTPTLNQWSLTMSVTVQYRFLVHKNISTRSPFDECSQLWTRS